MVMVIEAAPVGTSGQRSRGSQDMRAAMLNGGPMTSAHDSTLVRTFAALRFATGVAAWLAPNKTGRLMGLSSGHDQPFTAQLFGSRELTLALAITEPVSSQLRTRALQLGLLVDILLDVIAAQRGLRGRMLSPTGAIVAGGGAALFASLGVAALGGQNDSAVAST